MERGGGSRLWGGLKLLDLETGGSWLASAAVGFRVLAAFCSVWVLGSRDLRLKPFLSTAATSLHPFGLIA